VCRMTRKEERKPQITCLMTDILQSPVTRQAHPLQYTWMGCGYDSACRDSAFAPTPTGVLWEDEREENLTALRIRRELRYWASRTDTRRRAAIRFELHTGEQRLQI
jgi:hypothetical protein